MLKQILEQSYRQRHLLFCDCEREAQSKLDQINIVLLSEG